MPKRTGHGSMTKGRLPGKRELRREQERHVKKKGGGRGVINEEPQEIPGKIK